MKILKNILQLILLPLILAGAFFTWSLPRITTDYNFNTDELIYLSRSNYWDAFKSGDYQNKIWSEWGGYDQPQLTNYIYATVPGDRSLIDPKNSPCTDPTSSSFYKTWDCLAGPPIDTWPTSLAPLKKMVVSARTLALGISSLAIAVTYYLGFIVVGPVAGIIASIFLGYYSFFKNLSTMAMMDQILMVFLNLQLMLTLLITRNQKSNLTHSVLLGLVTGLAFSTKFSAIIPTIITFGYLTISSLRHKQIKFPHLLLSSFIALALFYSLQPNLWISPVEGVAKMLSWRATQLANQDPAIMLTTPLSRVNYTLKEILPTPILFPVIMSSILLLTSSHLAFATISLLNLVLFILVLPTSWNRYLLPILPTIAIYLGSFPTLLMRRLRELGTFLRRNLGDVRQLIVGMVAGLALILLFFLIPQTSYLSLLILGVSLFLAIQGFIVTRSMLYGFSHRQEQSIPTHAPQHGFSVIVPARDEAGVIGTTLRSLTKLNYPTDLYEVLVMIRADDTETLTAASAAVAESRAHNIRIIQIDGDAHNKSYSLNIGLKLAKYDTVGIFDAEDEPHRDILARVNDYLCTHPHVGAVQAPVHLTNLNSTWFSSLNATEYYYWFASVLPYLATKGIVPLGGNTIFTKKAIYQKLGFYDESCLTEDADLGIRLAARAIPVGIMTDATLATREEAPSSEIDVIRQRSRWDQGYLQVLEKSTWNTLSNKQKLYALYTLTQPIFRHLSFLNMIFTPLLGILGTVPLHLTLISFLPAYFLLIQLGLYLLGISTLARLHGVRVSPWRYVSTLLAFIPYQALLTLATLRALGKIIIGNYSWDKTNHTNAHRITGYPALVEGLY